MSVLFCRCESVGGDRERPVAAGSKWSGEGVLPHQQEKVSADGCAGGAQCPDHYIRYMYCSFKYTEHTDTVECSSRNTKNSQVDFPFTINPC